MPAAGRERTMEHPAETPGGNSPPDCCIYMGSSPSPLDTKKENPRSGFSFLVRVVIQNFLKKPVISTVFKADE